MAIGASVGIAMGSAVGFIILAALACLAVHTRSEKNVDKQFPAPDPATKTVGLITAVDCDAKSTAPLSTAGPMVALTEEEIKCIR